MKDTQNASKEVGGENMRNSRYEQPEVVKGCVDEQDKKGIGDNLKEVAKGYAQLGVVKGYMDEEDKKDIAKGYEQPDVVKGVCGPAGQENVFGRTWGRWRMGYAPPVVLKGYVDKEGEMYNGYSTGSEHWNNNCEKKRGGDREEHHGHDEKNGYEMEGAPEEFSEESIVKQDGGQSDVPGGEQNDVPENDGEEKRSRRKNKKGKRKDKGLEKEDLHDKKDLNGNKKSVGEGARKNAEGEAKKSEYDDRKRNEEKEYDEKK